MYLDFLVKNTVCAGKKSHVGKKKDAVYVEYEI